MFFLVYDFPLFQDGCGSAQVGRGGFITFECFSYELSGGFNFTFVLLVIDGDATGF